MAEYTIFFSQAVSASVRVEAEDIDEAVDLAYYSLPGDVCAQCSGWGSDYSMELNGEWQVDEDALKDAES